MSADITDVMHVLGGILTSAASFKSPLLSTFMFASFIAYELSEYYRLNDQVYKDILEYMVGLYAGYLIFNYYNPRVK